MSESVAPRARASEPSSRGAATARRISAAAVDLVLEHGYDATTVDMICAAAGVSQRTFFNHFPTKEASVIGVDGPRLDESRVRAFIAGTSPSILGDAIELIAQSVLAAAPDIDGMRRRMQAITSSPTLMQRQIDQFAVIERELAEIVQYRLARVSSPDEPEGDLQAQSRLTAHLLAGVMRYVAGAVMAGDRAAAGDAIVETRRQLAALLPKLAGG